MEYTKSEGSLDAFKREICIFKKVLALLPVTTTFLFTFQL